MNFMKLKLLVSGLSLLTLTACNTSTDPNTPLSADPDENRYHEKSFSWTETTGPLAKGSALSEISNRETKFETPEVLKTAIESLVAKLDDKAFTDSLWKPVDYACDELDLAVWNEYGTVFLGDSVVFDEEMLRGRCRLSDEVETELDTESLPLAKQSTWKWWNKPEVVDRQYPYKMIGRSWDHFDWWAYKSTGGETQFEKRRSRFGITSWYDTDATRIGVRVYFFDCGIDEGQRYCYHGDTKTSWYKNDDYVSVRDWAVGKITIRSNKFPTIKPAELHGSDVALSMHSVDHAGLQFRAYSFSNPNETAVFDLLSPDFVTW